MMFGGWEMLGGWDSFRMHLLLSKRQQDRWKGAWLPPSLQILGGFDLNFKGTMFVRQCLSTGHAV